MTMLFEPGQVVFIMNIEHPEGGYPGVIVEESRRKGCYIIRKKIGEYSYKQVVPDSVIKGLNDAVKTLYRREIEFLLSKYNEFDRMK